MQDIVHRYRFTFNVDQVDLDHVFDWAIAEGLWEPKPNDPRKQFRRDASRALAVEYITDAKGREVRRMHPVPIRLPSGQLMWEWGEIYSLLPRSMRLSLQARRRGILADVRQHKSDADSYNDFNIHGAQLDPFDYDFNKDNAEEELPTDYPDAPSDDDQ